MYVEEEGEESSEAASIPTGPENQEEVGGEQADLQAPQGLTTE